MRFAQLFRGVVVTAFVAFLAACDTGTEPEVVELEELETFEFSATVERTGDLGGLLAHHEPGVTPSPGDFIWPSTSEYGRVGKWEPDSSPAHTFGVQMGFGGLPPGEVLTIEFRLEWVNGLTKKPFDFSPNASTHLERYQGKVYEEVNLLYTLQEIAPNRYRLGFTIPSDPTWSYTLYVLPGVTLRCNAKGIKALVLSDASFSTSSGWRGRHEGSVLFTGTCQQSLIRYSRG